MTTSHPAYTHTACITQISNYLCVKESEVAELLRETWTFEDALNVWRQSNLDQDDGGRHRAFEKCIELASTIEETKWMLRHMLMCDEDEKRVKKRQREIALSLSEKATTLEEMSKAFNAYWSGDYRRTHNGSIYDKDPVLKNWDSRALVLLEKALSIDEAEYVREHTLVDSPANHAALQKQIDIASCPADILKVLDNMGSLTCYVKETGTAINKFVEYASSIGNIKILFQNRRVYGHFKYHDGSGVRTAALEKFVELASEKDELQWIFSNSNKATDKKLRSLVVKKLAKMCFNE